MLTSALAIGIVVLLYSVLYLYRRRGDALVDMITGLPSRDFFVRYVQTSTARAMRRRDYGFGILLLDIRGFGEIRKTVGRFAAEEILADFAERVFWAIRPTDVLTRLEKDNFAIVLEDVRGISDVTRVAMRVHRSMTEAVTLASTEVDVQLNIGVTMGRGGLDRDVQTLIAEAETALTRAIDSDRPYVVFDPALDAQSQTELALEAYLTDAVSADRLEMRYQPWVDSVTREIIGFTALVRLRHPDRGLLDAHEFIALAEGSRLIIPIGRWAVMRAATDLARLTAAAGRPVLMSVNVGPAEVERGDVAGALVEALGDRRELASQIRIELPASLFSEALPSVERLSSALNELGVGVHADHTAVGNLALGRAMEFGVRGVRLKLMGATERDADRLNRTIAGYRHVVEEVVLELIDSPEQDELARAVHPAVGMQGNYIARPMTLEDAIEVARGRRLTAD